MELWRETMGENALLHNVKTLKINHKYYYFV